MTNLTYASLVEQTEGATSERGESHAEDSTDVAVHRRGDDSILQAQYSLIHEPVS